MQAFVRLLPCMMPRHADTETVAVVIDVLRASTTIVAALEAGAAGIIPCTTVQMARQVSQSSDGILLAGERSGLPIAGFDLGNSPWEYTPDRVHGREIALTTTNGTRALARCRHRSAVVVAAFTNRTAIVERIARSSHVEFVCAGTDGSVTLEDVWLAGSLLDELTRRGNWTTNDAGQLSLSAWQRESKDGMTEQHLADRLAETQGGRNLVALGMRNDLEFAARCDRSSVVAEYDVSQHRIRLA